MSSRSARPRSRPRRVILLVAALFVVAPPVGAYAHLPQITYASGTGGVGATYRTTGFNHRDYNQVWHQSGRTWDFAYLLTDGSLTGYVINTNNPTRWGGEIGYAKSTAVNYDDNSGVTWTCQTTG